jgi:chemotaxis regulatin CheY-phosphate phosphatase CheZ
MAINVAELPRRIEELVHLLRGRDERKISLVDVASVTGILISTMQAYFSSIDTKIYTEFADLSKYIDQARKDIAALQPADLSGEHIPRAGQELDAIVEATESATNTIMEAAEQIMAADTSDTAAYQELVGDAVMRIFEACSFQDITGQRISKVVETFTYIESRLNKVAKLIEGVEGLQPDEPTEETPAEKRKREQILHGPALNGDGRDQGEVDALMSGKPKPNEPECAEEEEVAVKIAVNGNRPAPASAPLKAESGNSSDQNDIDAMFN